MPGPTTANEFLDLVRKSGVLDEAALAREFPDPDGLPTDPHRCAGVLINAKLLTAFQAKSLLAGKYQGLVVGQYRILEPIGKGGMGAVYKAEHASLRRTVAVKVLPRDKARDRATLERFQREARAAAALDHPNIVRIFDVGQGAGVHFLALEYVDGMTLDRLVERTGPLHFPTAAHYIAQAAAGLAHAHAAGFVHRDVKPGNLMVTREGTVKILDMGLARSLDRDEDKLTERLDGAGVLGTVDFIAPEQAVNSPAVDHRADVYSLGATLFALVTGRPPYEGSSTQKLMQHQMAAIPRLADVQGVPAGLSEVIERMMAKRPEDRIQSAAEVIDALAPWLPATPVTLALDAASTGTLARSATGRATTRVNLRAATGTAWLQQAPRKARPTWPLAAGAAAVALLLVGGGVYLATRSDGSPPAGRTLAAQASAAPAPTPKPAPKPAPKSIDNHRYRPLTLDTVATASTYSYLMGNPAASARLAFLDWGPKEYRGIPFRLTDPLEGARNNAIILYSANRPDVTGQYPRSVTLPVGAAAAAVHVLGGVAGWGYPYGYESKKEGQPIGVPQGTDSVVVRVRYADGAAEEHVWQNGVHLADYNKSIELSEAEVAFELEPRKAYLRYLVIRPRRTAVVKEIEFAKAAADEYTCPAIMAVTVETP